VNSRGIVSRRLLVAEGFEAVSTCFSIALWDTVVRKLFANGAWHPPVSKKINEKSCRNRWQLMKV
jgi:hypothetical protein